MLDVLDYIPNYTVPELLALGPVDFYCTLKIAQASKTAKEPRDIICNGWTISSDYQIIEIRYLDRSYFVPTERVLESVRIPLPSDGKIPIENE